MPRGGVCVKVCFYSVPDRSRVKLSGSSSARNLFFCQSFVCLAKLLLTMSQRVNEKMICLFGRVVEMFGCCCCCWQHFIFKRKAENAKDSWSFARRDNNSNLNLNSEPITVPFGTDAHTRGC